MTITKHIDVGALNTLLTICLFLAVYRLFVRTYETQLLQDKTFKHIILGMCLIGLGTCIRIGPWTFWRSALEANNKEAAAYLLSFSTYWTHLGIGVVCLGILVMYSQILHARLGRYWFVLGIIGMLLLYFFGVWFTWAWAEFYFTTEETLK